MILPHLFFRQDDMSRIKPGNVRSMLNNDIVSRYSSFLSRQSCEKGPVPKLIRRHFHMLIDYKYKMIMLNESLLQGQSIDPDSRYINVKTGRVDRAISSEEIKMVTNSIGFTMASLAISCMEQRKDITSLRSCFENHLLAFSVIKDNYVGHLFNKNRDEIIPWLYPLMSYSIQYDVIGFLFKFINDRMLQLENYLIDKVEHGEADLYAPALKTYCSYVNDLGNGKPINEFMADMKARNLSDRTLQIIESSGLCLGLDDEYLTHTDIASVRPNYR